MYHLHHSGSAARGAHWAVRFGTWVVDAAIASRSRLAWMGLAVAFLVDVAMHTLPLPFVLSTSSDEVGHAATAAVFLAALPLGISSRFVLGTLIGAVGLDLDHISIVFAIRDWVPSHGRPYTHCLLTVPAMVLIAWMLPRWRVAFTGIGFGLATHLVRDLSTGILPLFWPLTDRQFSAPYAVYAVIALLLATSTLRQQAQLKHNSDSTATATAAR